MVFFQAIITSQSPAGNVVTFAASGANQIVAQIPQQIVQVIDCMVIFKISCAFQYYILKTTIVIL